MTKPENTPTSHPNSKPPVRVRDPLRPLRLDLAEPVVERLKAEHIFADWRASSEYQPQAQQWVIRATEGGGAVKACGHYVGYCGPKGERLRYAYELASLAPNGSHAIVIAQELVKIEMLRIHKSYQLMISHHSLLPRGWKDKKTGQERRAILNQLKFRRIYGDLDLDLVNKDARLAGMVEPLFKSRVGEVIAPPKEFLPAVRAATAAVNCLFCDRPFLVTREHVDWSGNSLPRPSQNTEAGAAKRDDSAEDDPTAHRAPADV